MIQKLRNLINKTMSKKYIIAFPKMVSPYALDHIRKERWKYAENFYMEPKASFYFMCGIRLCLVCGSISFGRCTICICETLPSTLQSIRQRVHSPLGCFDHLFFFLQRSLCSASNCPCVRRV